MNNTVTVGNTKSKIKFVANGKDKIFNFFFPIFSPQDLDIYFNGELQSDNFTTTLMEKGGLVTFSSPPPEGIIISIVRNLPIKRTTDFSESKAFRSKMLNYEFDYQVACLEQLSDKSDLTIALPDFISDEVKATFPFPEAGKALMWNENGTQIINSKIDVEQFDRALSGALSAAETTRTFAQTAIEASENITQTIDDFSQSTAKKDLSNVDRDSIYLQFWESDAYAWTTYSTVNVNHNLELTPEQIKRAIVDYKGVFIMAFSGWSIGDEITGMNSYHYFGNNTTSVWRLNYELSQNSIMIRTPQFFQGCRKYTDGVPVLAPNHIKLKLNIRY